MVWEPKTCCCGASVKTGTLVLGWLGLIGSLLHALGLLKFAAMSQQDIATICKSHQPSIDGDICANGVIGGAILVGGLVLLGIMVCSMLLYGVNKNKPIWMLPYLICQVFGQVCIGITGVALFLLFCIQGVPVAAIITLLVFGLLMFLEVYFFLVARVCYKEVKQYSLANNGDSNIAYMEHKDVGYSYKI